MATFADKLCYCNEVLPLCKERLKSLIVDEKSIPFALSYYDVKGIKENYLKEVSFEKVFVLL